MEGLQDDAVAAIEQKLFRGGDHRLELLEVNALGRELCGDHDLPLGRDSLGVEGGNEGWSSLHFGGRPGRSC